MQFVKNMISFNKLIDICVYIQKVWTNSSLERLP